MGGGAPRRRLRWAALAVAGALLAAALLIGVRLRGRAVAAVALERTEIVQTVVATGRVATLARVEIGSIVAGTVSEVAVREGDRVSRGQVLARLRDDEARALAAQARSGLAQAEAAVAQAQAGAAAAAARLAQLRGTTLPAAEQAVRAAAAELESARRSFERTDALVAQGMLARADLDEARRALDTAAARHDREQTLAAGARRGGSEDRAAEAVLAQGEASVAQARAGVAQARAALAAAEARLAEHTLRAPADGTVVARAVEEGDTVQPGRTLLALSRPGRTEIVASLDEKNLALLAPGQKALVSADAYPGRSFAAELATLVPAVAAASGTVTARFAVADPPAYLLPEMTVSVEVEVARRPQALALPLEAVRDLAGEPWVLALRGGRARRVPVGVGARGASRVEIISGLAPGERVIPPSAGGVGDGDRVRDAL
jgi:HlyD family secretion protein